MGSGKDTVGSIMKYWLNYRSKHKAGSYSSYLLMDHWHNPGDWEVKKFADKLKEVASILTNVPVEKFEDQAFKNSDMPEEWDYIRQMTECDGDEGVDGYAVMPMSYRLFLQKLGTEAIREGLHMDTWINALMSSYHEERSKWIITDLRFPNELDCILAHGGITVRVTRPSTIPPVHDSETALDKQKFDYYINNTGSIEDLVIDVRDLLLTLDLIER